MELSSKIVANSIFHLSCRESFEPFPTRNDSNFTGRPFATHWALGYIRVGTLLWLFRFLRVEPTY